MADTLHAEVRFSFKGEPHAPAVTLDLDTLPLTPEAPPEIHRLLARAGGIDTYSYLFEVLESEEITYSAATGLARSCLHEGRFDWEAYRALREEREERRIVQRIAQEHLGIEELEHHPRQLAALLAAYRAGAHTPTPR